MIPSELTIYEFARFTATMWSLPGLYTPNPCLESDLAAVRGGDSWLRRTNPVAELVNLLSGGSHTPSRSVAGHEAVQNAIGELPEEYRQAVQLRLLEGKSLDETAQLMNRGPRVVQGLSDRAKKKMRAALGHLSMYE